MGLVLRREVFADLREQLDADVRVVFTNGCFDILHAGHLRLLQFARSLGDVLVVGVNSDSSVRTLKGAGRPVVSEARRARTLAAVPAVSFVIIFDESDPIETIKVVRPAAHVKGGDYTIGVLPEAEIVQALGGEIIIFPLVHGESTTGILVETQERAKPRRIE